MKAVILAGGMGTRISEESGVRPKPMVEIGDRPILWHVMKIYAAHGVKDFIICCGHKGHMIKDYFATYALRGSDVTFDFATGETTMHRRACEDWRVTLVDTGEATMTGGRLKRVREHIGEGTFLMTYGDGVADVDIAATLAFHKAHGRRATLTAVQPPGRFGAFTLQAGSDTISGFTEKPKGDGAWINGGFFVLEPNVLDLIAGDDTTFEREPLARLARDRQLAAYRHDGFWQPMDTLRDATVLRDIWASGKAPWAVWATGQTRPALKRAG